MASDDPWANLVSDEDFKIAITHNGYYQSPLSFQPFTKKYGLHLKQRAPFYLSIDFWSIQHETLTSNGFYVIRTGRGRFVIFHEDRFARPYLNLNTNHPKEIALSNTTGYGHLKRAFREHYQENANLEHLRFLGICKILVEDLCGKNTEFQIGPRGGRSSRFTFYMQDKSNSKILTAFEYEGQEEMDYTIWTEDTVFVFEAKQKPRLGSGLDIGLHKLAFPCMRFRGYDSLKIVPVYYLRAGLMVYLFVFPKIEFYDGGIILNDQSRFVPEASYSFNLASLNGFAPFL